MSLPFFAGFGLAGGSGLFLLRGAVGCSGFLVRFLVFRFWGFIAHNNFMLRIDWPAAWKFLRRQGHRASDAGSCKVRVAPPFSPISNFIFQRSNHELTRIDTNVFHDGDGGNGERTGGSGLPYASFSACTT